MKALSIFLAAALLALCWGTAALAETVIRSEDIGVFPVVTAKHPNATVLPLPMDADDPQPLLEIWFAKVSVCDCFAVRCNGKTMLIDGGNRQNGGATRGFLDALGFHRADYIYNTHHHDDHLEMQCSLVRRGEFWAPVFLTPYERDYPVEAQLEMQAAVDAAGIEYRTVRDGDVLDLGGATVEFHRWLGSTDPNYTSLFAKITYGRRSVWLMADVTGYAQKVLGEERTDIDWDADVLKAGHHGYAEQDFRLLTMMSPELCIITNSLSSGDKCIRQMKRNGIPYLMTNLGTVYMRTDGGDCWYYQQDSTPYSEIVRK